MESTLQDLASKIVALAIKKAPNRILVGVAGPPGSGKSTIVDKVVGLINSTYLQRRKLHAIGVSLDGFHYTREQLDTFPDPLEAHRRRGAPWTFDVDGVTQFVCTLQHSKTNPTSRKDIVAPTFDHALKDPVADGCLISAAADIVILDSNYILLDHPDWRGISQAFDFKVFINIDPMLARARVAKRHVLAGIEPTIERGVERFDSNDALNGELVRSKLLPHDFVVYSI